MILLLAILTFEICYAQIPLVVNTWSFQQATVAAWKNLQKTNSSIDALVEGCRTCQNLQCDFTVGFGGSPDENGENTLDALIFDGNNMNMGAVGGLRNIKDAIGVARNVLENTKHSLLVGNLATEFAVSLGYPNESLQTNYSDSLWRKWKECNCQPNFWTNVVPDPEESCGPYKVLETSEDNEVNKYNNIYSSRNHDTIGMIVISKDGHVVAGTSTNGAKFKIPGRVGDSPIPGAGAYADSKVGAATATGDGDVMMRFLPSFLAVEKMRQGASPQKAATEAISQIAKKYPTFFGGVVAVNRKGIIGAACNGMEKFPYSVASASGKVPVITKYVRCIG